MQHYLLTFSLLCVTTGSMASSSCGTSSCERMALVQQAKAVLARDNDKEALKTDTDQTDTNAKDLLVRHGKAPGADEHMHGGSFNSSNFLGAGNAETQARGADTLAVFFHFSHEGGRQMVDFLGCGLGLPVSDQAVQKKDSFSFSSLCTAEGYQNYIDKHGFVVFETEQSAGHFFPSIMSPQCHKIVTITVMRDPIALHIRAFLRPPVGVGIYAGQSMPLNLPENLPVKNAHVYSVLTMGEHMKYEDVDWTSASKKAQSILERMDGVCIMEMYRDCVPILAHALRLEMSFADVQGIIDRRMSSGYLSQNHSTGEAFDYVQDIRDNGTPDEKRWVQQHQADNALDIKLYGAARRISQRQLGEAMKLLQDRLLLLKFPGTVSRLGTLSHALEKLDASHLVADVEEGSHLPHC